MKKVNKKLLTSAPGGLSYLTAVLLFFMMGLCPFSVNGSYLMMDAPESVYQLHDFDVEIYVFDVSDLYGVACDVLYTEDLVDVLDDDPGSEGVQPALTEGEFLNEGGTEETIMRGAFEDGKVEGRLVLGLTRSAQIPGVDSGFIPQHLMTVSYKAVNVGFAEFSFDQEGMVDSGENPLSIDGATGVTVEILAFTNHPPNMPSNPYPADGETGVPLSLQLTWEGGDQDEDDIITYYVYMDETDPPETLYDTVTNPWDQTVCTVDATLEMGHHYYWKVIAEDMYEGLTTEGPVWDFVAAGPSPTPTNTPTPTLSPTSTFTLTPTLTYTPEETPTPSVTPTVAPVPATSTAGLALLALIISFGFLRTFRKKD